MKKLILLSMLFCVYAFAQSDVANNYNSWTDASNAGTGFGAWSLTTTGSTGYAGFFLGDAAASGFGDLDATSKDFGMYGNQGDMFANASRSFSSSLADNNTFRIDLAIQWRNGNKGIDVKVGSTVVYHFRCQSDNYYVREGASGSDVNLGWSYSATSIFKIEVMALSSTAIMAKLTRGSDVRTSGVITTTGRVTGFHVYIGSSGSDGRDNLFFNNLSIRSTSPLPVELAAFNYSLIRDAVKLNWNTASETNNAGFHVLRSTDQVNWADLGFVAGNGYSATAHDYSFVDSKTVQGTMYYRLKQVDNDGTTNYSNTLEVTVKQPVSYSLNQNFPNPFNPVTKISFTTPAVGNAKLTVFNCLGKEVAVLINSSLAAGKHEYTFDGSKFSSGVYYYKLEAGNFVAMKKLILMK
ncbi:MAG: T9SS type A sorting domain-containing protein [Ignavibacteria bacterium]|nr:T9SS type A sorting domain-containing protein [Ignavibacteria bacterium]